MDLTNQFSVEREVFERHRKEWLFSHRGKFVVIQGDVIAEGFFGTYADALKAGLQTFWRWSILSCEAGLDN
jgi:hypothetical protein